MNDEEFLELKELYLEGQKRQQELEEEIEKAMRMLNSLTGMVNALLESTIEDLEDLYEEPTPRLPLQNGTHDFNS